MTTLTTDQLATWLSEQTWSDFAQSLASYHASKGYLTEKQEAAARKMHVKCMVNAAAKAAPAPAPKVALAADGIFHRDGTVYKVQYNQTGTYLYAKVLVINESHDFDTHGKQKGTWDYAGKAPLYTLTEADRLDYAMAKELGALYGVCVNCGRVLSDEDSIYNGYGKTCASNKGWPYEKAPALLLG